MSSQASLAIATTATESLRPRPSARRRFSPRYDLPPGEPAPLTAHDRFVASAMALFPGSTLVD